MRKNKVHLECLDSIGVYINNDDDFVHIYKKKKKTWKKNQQNSTID